LSKKNTCVHRLVGQAFIPNPENKPEVDHINRIRHDNRLENLRWATREENQENKGTFKNNISGYKHISTRIDRTCEYWVIKINTQNVKIQKIFNKSNYTLEQVVEERNKIYAENNIIALD
jgi:hypothetical protein